jgi:hypothetical protein
LGEDPFILLAPLLFHFLQLGLADDIFDAGGEMACIAAQLADPTPDPHHHLRQFLGPDEQQGHHRHDQQFRSVDAEHRRLLSERYERV